MTPPRWSRFGGYDAPMVDGFQEIEPPTDMKCLLCEEPILAEDMGYIDVQGNAIHAECGFRSVMGGIGHHVDHLRYCRGDLGPDAGLSRRLSSKLVWEFFHGPLHPVTVAELEEIRNAQ